jgi:hypothetical protein
VSKQCAGGGCGGKQLPLAKAIFCPSGESGSRGEAVFVNDAAEAVAAFDPG